MTLSHLMPSNRSNPFAAYAQLRHDCPVHWDPNASIWIISRYHDVAAVLRDSHRVSAAILAADSFEICSPEDGRPLPKEDMLLASDQVKHQQLRKLLSKFFYAGHAKKHEQVARATLRRIVKVIGPLGACDFVADICTPVANSVMNDFFGLAADQHENLGRWMQICGASNAQSRPPSLQNEFVRVLHELWSLIRQPNAIAEDRFLYGLIAAQAKGEISAAQVLDLCSSVLKGGADTTTYLAGNALFSLAAQPALARRLRTSPDLIPNFIEESLRYDAPVQATIRQTTEAFALSGITLPAGSRTLLLIGAANHDAAVFEDGDQFLLERQKRSHLAFGSGAHKCPGTALVRMQARLILETVLQDMPDMLIQTQAALEVDRYALRGLNRLPLTYAPFVSV